MQLDISNELVSQLIFLEKTILTLPRNAEHASFYKKQVREAQLLDVLTLAESMELAINIEDLKDLLDSSEARVHQQNHKYVKNCINVMKYARTIREHAFTTSVVQHENKLLADGFSDFWEEGKVRATHETPNYIHDGLRNRTTHPNYQLWTDIRQELSYPNEKIHPLLLAGITVYHLVSSYPFLQSNLQTALLCGYTIVKPTEYWVSGTVSILNALWKTLQRTDFTFDASPDHFTHFMEKLLKDYSTQVETIHDALAHQTSIPAHIRTTLNDRQLKILTYFKQHKKLTRKKYSAMMNIAIATAFRDLNDLHEKGLIKAVGKGRGTSYILAQIATPGELSDHEPEERLTKIVDEDTSY